VNLVAGALEVDVGVILPDDATVEVVTREEASETTEVEFLLVGAAKAREFQSRAFSRNREGTMS
jgi:hypothetical protein